jgi:hypothetical protein
LKFVVFGLTITSSWGNGHATLWRALCRALARRGNRMVFFEKDVPWYAGAHDLVAERPGVTTVLYPDWDQASPIARRHLAHRIPRQRAAIRLATARPDQMRGAVPGGGGGGGAGAQARDLAGPDR